MKLALFALLFISSFAHAGIFRADSKLPKELQTRIEKLISERCLSSLYGIEEESTTVRKQHVDQLSYDYYYRTEINAHYYFDGMHPVGVRIFVDSAEYDIDNPAVDRYEVSKLQADSSEVCR